MEIWVVIMAAMFAPLAWASARNVRERQRARARLRAAAAFDASIQEGAAVRITGTVAVQSETLTAPLSGLTCVAFRARIYIFTDFTAPRPRETARAVEFALERPGAPRLVVASEHVIFDLSVLAPLQSDRCTKFADAHELTHKERSQATWEEIAITPGMRISVAGTLMRDVSRFAPRTELGFRETPAELRLVGNAQHPVVIGAPLT